MPDSRLCGRKFNRFLRFISPTKIIFFILAWVVFILDTTRVLARPTRAPPLATDPPAPMSRPEAELFRDAADSFFLAYPSKLKMLLVVRNDLNMTKGKVAAQCAHAAMGIVVKYLVPQHDLLMLDIDDVPSEHIEDDRVFERPSMSDSSDEDDEDWEDEDSDDCDSKPKTHAVSFTAKADDVATGDASATPAVVPADQCAAVPLVALFPASPVTPTDISAQPQVSQTPSKCPSTPASPKPVAPRGLRLTPREIRKELYKIDTPLHALMKFIIARWMLLGQGKIAVKVNSNEEMSILQDQLRDQGIPFYEIWDAGLTQIAANTRTVMAVGPFPAQLIDPILGKLKLL